MLQAERAQGLGHDSWAAQAPAVAAFAQLRGPRWQSGCSLPAQVQSQRAPDVSTQWMSQILTLRAQSILLHAPTDTKGFAGHCHPQSRDGDHQSPKASASCMNGFLSRYDIIVVTADFCNDILQCSAASDLADPQQQSQQLLMQLNIVIYHCSKLQTA